LGVVIQQFVLVRPILEQVFNTEVLVILQQHFDFVAIVLVRNVVVFQKLEVKQFLIEIFSEYLFLPFQIGLKDFLV
jgi:hypothetical protein